MHWYELLIYAVSSLSVATAVVIAVLGYRFFTKS